jgi:hypothetical protein
MIVSQGTYKDKMRWWIRIDENRYYVGWQYTINHCVFQGNRWAVSSSTAHELILRLQEQFDVDFETFI